jgi:hypothetical protein
VPVRGRRHPASRGDVASGRQCRRGRLLARGDPNIGDFEDAVVLKAYGEVPDDFGYG